MGVRVRVAAAAAILGAVPAMIGSTAVAQAAGMPGNDGAFSLTSHTAKVRDGYAPTFTGNGLLGVRVPPAGQGYEGGKVPAQSELAGFYGQASTGTGAERVQQRANIPTWSTLTLGVAGARFAPRTGNVSDYRQSLALRTGIVTTSGRWTAPGGRVTDITYRVLTDRARENVGLVRLSFIPRWSGTATVDDLIDGTPDTRTPKKVPVLTKQVGKSWDLDMREDDVTIATLGTGIQATLASELDPASGITATSTRVGVGKAQSVGQRVRFHVVKGHIYTFTKYVGIQDTADAVGEQRPENSPATTQTAQQAAASAAAVGWTALLAENRAAWATIWKGRIDVTGDRTLATDVNASQFYLWSSTRADQDWSVSPAGLSSNGYDGHIFWDAETWMFPTLLAQHPDLANAMEDYRFDRLAQARKHAAQTGAKGARFPWESALDGTEQIPPPVRLNSEGLYEQHITADIALAQWQYYEATGNGSWLRQRGWPVISGAATFWASRAHKASGGGYVISHITGPDEENPDVSDEAYTEVAARTTLRDAITAAHRTGHSVPANWTTIAKGLQVPVAHGINPEFSGYQNQLVKQADVTLLNYPWDFRSSPAVERADLAFYVPRTDPGGPSMDDAVSSIESNQLSPASCQAYVYTERSYQPYIRDVFHQFSETRTGGAFTFMTGIGGFLQEFLYGYSGLRWEGSSVQLAPGLSGPLTSVTLHDLKWHGRTFTLSIHRDSATVTLLKGAPLPITTAAAHTTVSTGHPVKISTAAATASRATGDPLRCGQATATSTAPGEPALAAVDGTAATNWQPAAIPATLTAPMAGGAHRISRVTVHWGRTWPPVIIPNVHPRPAPVRTVRSRRYAVQVSTRGAWRTVATVDSASSRTRDTIIFPAVRASGVRLRLLAGSGVETIPAKSKTATPPVPILPMVQELTVN
jgi:trehalose/maltose hydrolase-like predicted phosphorylase